MLTFDYLKRLGLHGSRLLWRVFMILVPVIGYSFWQAFKETFSSSRQPSNDYPVIRSELDAWRAFREGKIGAAEMEYYEEIYGD
mgnify:CR=1 FL=1